MELGELADTQNRYSMKCAAETTGLVGAKTHRDWCLYHNAWTFDCLLKQLRLWKAQLIKEKNTQN